MLDLKRPNIHLRCKNVDLHRESLDLQSENLDLQRENLHLQSEKLHLQRANLRLQSENRQQSALESSEILRRTAIFRSAAKSFAKKPLVSARMRAVPKTQYSALVSETESQHSSILIRPGSETLTEHP